MSEIKQKNVMKKVKNVKKNKNHLKNEDCEHDDSGKSAKKCVEEIRQSKKVVLILLRVFSHSSAII